MIESPSSANTLPTTYRFEVISDPDGGYVVRYPDLPGCMTQVDRLEEVGPAAEEIRELWIEAARDLGQPIPAPSEAGAFSGRFNVRMPRSLHRDLVLRAAAEGVSLNQFVVSLLADRSTWHRISSPSADDGKNSAYATPNSASR